MWHAILNNTAGELDRLTDHNEAALRYRLVEVLSPGGAWDTLNDGDTIVIKSDDEQ